MKFGSGGEGAERRGEEKKEGVGRGGKGREENWISKYCLPS